MSAFRAVPRFLTAALLATAACGPPALKPVAAPDPEVSCPAGTGDWSLEVLDRRVTREASDRLVQLLRDSVERSFPGCRWSAGADPGRATVTLEIHRFGAPLVEGTWEGVAEWTVAARDAGGRELTRFEVDAEVFRPNYRNSNNEKEALSKVFQEALERTLAGLRAVSSPG